MTIGDVTVSIAIQPKNLAVNLRLNRGLTIIQTKNLAVNLGLNRGPLLYKPKIEQLIYG